MFELSLERHFVSVDEIVDATWNLVLDPRPPCMAQASGLVPRGIHTSARLRPVQCARDAPFVELAYRQVHVILMRRSSSVLLFRFTAMSSYLVFSVDQYLRANEGHWPYDNKVTHTRYCNLGTRCIIVLLTPGLL